MSEQEYEIKPQKGLTKEKFEQESLILLSRLDEYKALDKMIKQYMANCKEYMTINEIQDYKNEAGTLFLKPQNRNMLNRALIPEIEKY
jgi:hypothetical protein